MALTPTQKRFLEAVSRGDAVQLRRDNPYRTLVRGSDRAVPRPVLNGVHDLVEIDFNGGDTWEKPYRLTDAGRAALAEETA